MGKVQAKIGHPKGPDVAEGDLVIVESRAAGREVPSYNWGEVLAPGYTLALASTKVEPSMRVIAVRMLATNEVIDATSWKLLARSGSPGIREAKVKGEFHLRQALEATGNG